MLKAQAYSLDRYWDCSGEIFVIVNDSKDVCDEIDKNWWGRHHDKVKIIHHGIWYQSVSLSGWVTQQICKTLGPTLSTADWCIVFDAKSLLVQRLSDGDFASADGRIDTKHQGILPVFQPSKDIIDRVFDIDLQQIAGPGGIPHWMHIDSCKKLKTEIIQLSGKSLVDFWITNGMLTEFMLHSGYLQYRYGSIDELYTDQQSFEVVQLAHNEQPLFMSKYKEMLQDNVLTVCIHKEAWNNHLTQMEKMMFNRYLEGKGLISYDHMFEHM